MRGASWRESMSKTTNNRPGSRIRLRRLAGQNGTSRTDSKPERDDCADWRTLVREQRYAEANGNASIFFSLPPISHPRTSQAPQKSSRGGQLDSDKPHADLSRDSFSL